MRTRAHGTNGCARDESEGKGRQRRYCGDVVLFEGQHGHFPTAWQPRISPQLSLVRLAPALSLDRYASTLSSFQHAVSSSLPLLPRPRHPRTPRCHRRPAPGARALSAEIPIRRRREAGTVARRRRAVAAPDDGCRGEAAASSTHDRRNGLGNGERPAHPAAPTAMS